MDADFWHARWRDGQIGFHEGAVNALLVAHLDALGLAPGARIFLPLCGKTRDIAWLRARGLDVAGAELSEIAVAQLFDEIGETPDVTASGALTRYAAPGIDVFVGDIFALDAATLGPVDASYDRAALVALPAGMRARYARHMTALTARAPQLLITFTYDQSVMNGPPFSVPPTEVEAHYAESYTVAPLASRAVEGGLKGIAPATETIWHLV